MIIVIYLPKLVPPPDLDFVPVLPERTDWLLEADELTFGFEFSVCIFVDAFLFVCILLELLLVVFDGLVTVFVVRTLLLP